MMVPNVRIDTAHEVEDVGRVAVLNRQVVGILTIPDALSVLTRQASITQPRQRRPSGNHWYPLRWLILAHFRLIDAQPSTDRVSSPTRLGACQLVEMASIAVVQDACGDANQFRLVAHVAPRQSVPYGFRSMGRDEKARRARSRKSTGASKNEIERARIDAQRERDRYSFLLRLAIVGGVTLVACVWALVPIADSLAESTTGMGGFVGVGGGGGGGVVSVTLYVRGRTRKRELERIRGELEDCRATRIREHLDDMG